MSRNTLLVAAAVVVVVVVLTMNAPAAASETPSTGNTNYWLRGGDGVTGMGAR